MRLRLRGFLNGFAKITNFLPATILLALGLMTFQSIGATPAPDNNAEVSVIKRALPDYPKYAVKNGIEGTVLISFSIEKDGNVSDIQVAASDQDGLFDASAILGVQRWVYTKPAKKVRNNYVAIEFALTDNPATSNFSNVEKIQVRGN
ncbi:energy transducer TonB [Thalassotalea mangrovi]|uniref:Protein TonB n=1 Tax=Thalassotalea mangrovi TaxID=2572245 RepID=A0A4U1B7H3_9GAMM|nr:energy transducer TonB [Thalassotalea mangrovi]TKB46433.1 energy transducer TonB [Thalassotalea mangrovi]